MFFTVTMARGFWPTTRIFFSMVMLTEIVAGCPTDEAACALMEIQQVARAVSIVR
jgi:hypothetical protein